MAYKIRPLNNYPRMPKRDFDLLVTDVRKHGVREPTVIFGNKILDRCTPAKFAGKSFKVRQFDPQRDGDPAALVTSRNDHRRHLTPEQKRELLAKSIKADPPRRSATRRGGRCRATN